MNEDRGGKAVIAIQVLIVAVLILWHFNERTIEASGLPGWAAILIWSGMVGSVIGGRGGAKGLLWGAVVGAIAIPLAIAAAFASLSVGR